MTVPRGMEKHAQFVNCRLSQDQQTGGIIKLPVNLRGEVIDPQDRANHLTAAQALTGLALGLHLAFVFTAQDDLFFIDVDHCIEDGQFSQTASEIYQSFPGAAAEVSQSGTGIHIFGSGARSVPDNHRCKNIARGVEFYTRGRFVMLTGTRLHGDANTDFSAVLPGFCERYALTPPPDALPVSETGIDPRYTFGGDDDAVIAAMLASRGSAGAAFGTAVHPRMLWEADAVALGAAFPAAGRLYDASSADAALLAHLAFWTGRDGPRMARIFERSGLMRDKWLKHPTYARNSLAMAVGRCERVYDKPAIAVRIPDGTPAMRISGGTSAYLRIEQQVELFAGCVYVQNRHAIMLPDGRLMKPEQFRAIFGGRAFQMRADNTGASRNAFEAFTENQVHRFPQARDVCFEPAHPPGALIAGNVNSWVPPQIEMQPGDVTPFLTHLAKLLPDPRDRKICLSYLQSAARNPGKKFQWAVVMQGCEGNGKTLLARCMRHVIGKDFTHSPRASEMGEKYNSWLERKLFVSVEEIYIAERRELLDMLKDAITNDEIEVRGMGREKTMTRNHANWFFTTNHKDAIPVDGDQRRYAIFYTAQQSTEDLKRDGMTEDYFCDLYDWLENKQGYAHVAHYLRYSPLDSEFDPAGRCVRAPMTTGSGEAIQNSFGRYEQTVLDAIDDERPGFIGGWVSTAALEALLTEKRLQPLHPRKTGQVLANIGYRLVGKATRSLMAEMVGNRPSRPKLWRKVGLPDGSTNDFISAQGYVS